MEEAIILHAAAQFGRGEVEVTQLCNSHYFRTFSANYTEANETIFLYMRPGVAKDEAERLASNYETVSTYLLRENDSSLPALRLTTDEKRYFLDEGNNFFRATAAIPGSFCLSQYPDATTAFESAYCIAKYALLLSGTTNVLTAPHAPADHVGFERYNNFEAAIKQASIMRLLRATHIISEIRQRKSLLNSISLAAESNDLPLYPVYYGLTPADILLDKKTGKAIMPLLLESAEPGFMYANVGSLLRTGVCAVDENSTAWESISVRPSYYEAILAGYLEGADGTLTEKEKKTIHFSGPFATYLRILELVTDFLQNDEHIPTDYPEQNLNRALNQFILLEQLEKYVFEIYYIHIYDQVK